MKIKSPEHDVELNGMIKSREFTIKTGAHIMSVLSNLYTNPVDAMVREYSTNMLDAYVALRKAKGVEPKDWTPPILSLPTKLEPVLMFKDFGIGMSEQMVWDVYTQYGNSTKNDSNDEIGGFGLGSKTAFCYNGGSAWSVESRHNGKLHTFMAFIGKDGVPSMTHASTVDTTEHSGVTIKIPIARQDVDAVIAAGEKYARYFPIPIEVRGATPSFKIDRDYIMTGNGWALHKTVQRDAHGWSRHEHVLNVVMGNVPYPITAHDVQGYGRNANFQHNGIAQILNYFSFDLFVKVGDVDIVPSRDSLQYTDRTKAALEVAYKAMLSDIPTQIENEIASCTSEYAAVQKAIEMMELLQGVFQKVDFHSLKWNGKVLNCRKGITRTVKAIQKFDPSASVVIYSNAFDDVFTDPKMTFGSDTYHRGTGTGDIVVKEVDSWVGRKRQYVVVNDMLKGGDRVAKAYLFGNVMAKTPGGRKAARGHKAGMVTLVTSTKTAQEIADFFGGMPVADVLYTSKLAPTVTIPAALKGAVDAVYKWGGGSWAARVNRPTGREVFYLPLAQDPHSGRWMYADGETSHSMRDAVDRIHNTICSVTGKGFEMTEVYGVKEDDLDSLDASWVNLETYTWDKAIAYLNKHVDSAALYERNSAAFHNNVMAYAIPVFKAIGSDMKGDAATVVTLYEESQKAYSKSAAFESVMRWCKMYATSDDDKATLSDIQKSVKSKVKTFGNVLEMAEKILEPYPMLGLVFCPNPNSYSYYGRQDPSEILRNTKTKDTLREYVKSIK